MQFSRMHEIQFHPATDMPYRRLIQHDYGRKLRGQRRGTDEMGETGEIQKHARDRVNERVNRIANEVVLLQSQRYFAKGVEEGVKA